MRHVSHTDFFPCDLLIDVTLVVEVLLHLISFRF